MSLFKLEKQEDESLASESKAHVAAEKKRANRLSKASGVTSDVIGTLEKDQTVHWVSMGEWSSHDLLMHILKEIGPAEVCLCTWSASEYAVRQIIRLCDEGKITKISALLDWRAKVRRPGRMS